MSNLFNKKLRNLRLRFNFAIARFYRRFLRKYGKINSSVFLFCSSPDYSDNAKALYLYMLNNKPWAEYNLFFVVKELNLCKEHFANEKIFFISSKNNYGGVPLRNLKLLLTAGTIFYTHSAPFPCEKQFALKEQRYINLWHGCGYKDNENKGHNRICTFDKALVPGPLFKLAKMKFWNAPSERILVCGYPRYDWILNPSKEAHSFSENIRNGRSKLVIWMPTFRNDKYNRLNETSSIKQFPLISNDMQWYDLDSFCKHLNLVLLIKLHQFQKDYLIDFKAFSNIKILNNNDLICNNVNLYELLPKTDALISDYSSVAIDYLIINRPIAFCLQDFEEYKKLRGFIFKNPKEFMPGHHLYTFDDLIGFLNDIAYSKDKFEKQRKEMCKIAITDSSCYCENLLKILELH